MLKLAPATEQFQHFVSNLRESFWGDLNGQTREAWKKFFEAVPAGLEEFQRRAPEVSLLIREAFLRGISTRQVGRVVAIVTGKAVSAQTVSRLTRDLDAAVQQFHEAP